MRYHHLAIDGPAGAGKSTVAKLVAKKLHYIYIDTGAMYRATTYKALKLGIDLNEPEAFGFLDETSMMFKDGILYMDDIEMTDTIRSREVSNHVSLVSSHIPVRNKLVALQQQIAKHHNVVMDGRDIGTVVLPQADLKIFMTASVDERAKRRHEENLALGYPSDYDTLVAEIIRRDGIDSSRDYNPLRQAEDAILLDTSHMDIEEVANTVYTMFLNAIKTNRSKQMEHKIEEMPEVNTPRVGDILKGTVIKVTDEEVLVDVGYMFEGTIYRDHLTNKKLSSAKDFVSEGDEIEVQVTKIAHGDSNNILLLSRKDIERKAVQKEFRSQLEIDKDITARVKKDVRGGLLLDFHAIELFLPDSLISLNPLTPEMKSELVGTDIEVRIIDIRKDRNRDKIIVNRKQLLFEHIRQAEKEALDAVNVGEIVTGKVVRIVDFGAFVQLSPMIEGLLHISEVSHYHIKDVKELLSLDQEITVKVIKKSGKRISLSKKALEEKPWDVFLQKYKVGDKVKGKVIKKMQFGMLLEVERQVSGLLNRSDYSWDPQDNLAGRVQMGDEIEVEITSISREKRQFTLSKKHLEYNPWADLKLKVGELVSATVKQIEEKGAVMEVHGVEAFLPMREISEDRINRIEDVLKLGDIHTVEVTAFFPREWQMTVSLKKVHEKKERRDYEAQLKDNVSASQTMADQLMELMKKSKK